MNFDLKNLQKVALSLSIVIVLNLLFNAAIAALYSSPKYDAFCREEHRKYYDNKQECEAVGGEWGAYVDNPYYPYPTKAITARPDAVLESTADEPKEYCNPGVACAKDFDKAQNLYNRNVFVMLIIL